MNPFDRVLAVSQLFILAAWEVIGRLLFGWNGWIVLVLWFVGLWTLNILTASVVRTYFKMMEPQLKVKDTTPLHAVPDIEITPEDIGG